MFEGVWRKVVPKDLMAISKASSGARQWYRAKRLSRGLDPRWWLFFSLTSLPARHILMLG